MCMVVTEMCLFGRVDIVVDGCIPGVEDLEKDVGRLEVPSEALLAR